MTDNNTTTADAAPSGRTPSHYVYQVRDRGEGQKGIWTRIGAAWPQRDGKGFNVQLDAIPLDGRRPDSWRQRVYYVGCLKSSWQVVLF